MNNQRRVRRSSNPSLDQPNQTDQTQSFSSGRRPIFATPKQNTPLKPFSGRKILYRFGLVLFGAFVAWILLFSDWLNIRGIVLKNSNTISQSEIQTEYETYIAQYPIDNKYFFINEIRFEDAIKNRYPTVAKVNIYRTFFFKIVVDIKESTPALVWKTGNQAWIISDDGRILKPDNGKESSLGSVQDTAQITVEKGDQVTNQGFVTFIRNIYASSQAYEIKVTGVEIASTTQEATLRLAGGLAVRVDTTRSAQDQLKAAQATIATAKKDNKPITQYIDVRVPGRTFYK
ncbi:MAG: hypothetical protein WCI47_01180 [bacterium]